MAGPEAVQVVQATNLYHPPPRSGLVDGSSAKDGTSANTNGTSCNEAHDKVLLRQILQTLQQSTITKRVDDDLRAQFYKTYKIEAEEFFADILRKYNGELDISLIFAGLFSAVNITVTTALQPNLSADPSTTTEILLKRVVQSLNSTAFAGQDLTLPQFNGPDSVTVLVQSLLYASLGASLFAALGAMMGKEWLSHYARVGERGTVEERCLDRQRKSIGMQVWHFDFVLSCIPILLQISLLLFGIALSAYMWNQQRAVASIIASMTAVGVVLYCVSILCSLLFPDCPFHTPITDITLRSWHSLWSLVLKTRDMLRRVLSVNVADTISWFRPTASSISSLSSNLGKLLRRGIESSSLAVRTLRLLIQSTYSIDARLDLSYLRGARINDSFGPFGQLQKLTVSKKTSKNVESVRLQLDAFCVEWLLATSTEPDVIATALRMVPTIEWHLFAPGLGSTLQLLQKTFIACFASPFSSVSPSTIELPHPARALSYGEGLVSMYMEAAATGQFSWDPNLSTFGFLCDFRTQDADLVFICDVLQVLSMGYWPELSEPPSYKADLENARHQNIRRLLPRSSLIDWFLHRMIPFLRFADVSEGLKIWLAITVSQWLEVPIGPQMSEKARADCLLISAMLTGYIPPENMLRSLDKSGNIHHILGSATSHLLAALPLHHLKNTAIGSARNLDAQDRASFILLAPVIKLLLQTKESDIKARSALHDANIHTRILILCRFLSDSGLYSTAQLSTLFPYHVDFLQFLEQPSRSLLNFSVFLSSPPLPIPPFTSICDPDYPISFVLSRIWKIRYESLRQVYNLPRSSDPDVESIRTDTFWISSCMKIAYDQVKVVDVLDATQKESSFTTLAYCLVVLSEISRPGLIYETEIYQIVCWAIRHNVALLRHAALKFIHALTLHGTPEMIDPLFISMPNGVAGLSQALMAAGPGLTDDHTRTPAHYMWIKGYLEILVGWTTAEEPSHKHIESRMFEDGHGRRCLEFAEYLAQSGPWSKARAWYVGAAGVGIDTLQSPERSPVFAFIGWPYDHSQTFAPVSHHYDNPYIRSVWLSLTQIIIQCRQYHRNYEADLLPLEFHAGIESTSDLKLAIAYVAWQICDTHPLPLKMGSSVSDYTKQVLLHWRVEPDSARRKRTRSALKVLKRERHRNLPVSPSAVSESAVSQATAQFAMLQPAILQPSIFDSSLVQSRRTSPSRRAVPFAQPSARGYRENIRSMYQLLKHTSS